MGDLISRKAIVKILTRLAVTGPKSHMRAYARCISEIECAPTVDAEPVRRGEWVIVRKMADGGEMQCSECKTIRKFTSLDRHTSYKFCPNCGAKMKEEGSV